jgi:hypothetical protein
MGCAILNVMRVKYRKFMAKIKYHPFFCYKVGCRKSIKATPEYLKNEIDTNFLWQILIFLQENNRGGFNKFLREFTGKTTESNFKEEVADLFFDRVIAWPEGKRYYAGASESWQINLFEGFRRDWMEEIEKFLKKKVDLWGECATL